MPFVCRMLLPRPAATLPLSAAVIAYALRHAAAADAMLMLPFTLMRATHCRCRIARYEPLLLVTSWRF